MSVELEQERIHAYLNGLMPPAEQSAFESQAESSDMLKEEIRRFRQMRLLAHNEQLFRGKAVLNAVMADMLVTPDYGPYQHYFGQRSAKNTIWRRFLVITLLLTAGAALVFVPRQLSNLALAEAAKTALQPYENMIGFSPDDQSNAALAMQAYDRKDYPQAIARLQVELNAYPNDHTLRLYLGICYLMTAQSILAEPLFREILLTQGLATTPAKWYLALSLLQHHPGDEARKLLQALETDPVFGDRAKALLEKF